MGAVTKAAVISHCVDTSRSFAARIMIVRMVDQCTTGDHVSQKLIPYFCLSPRTQNRALNFLTSPILHRFLVSRYAFRDKRQNNNADIYTTNIKQKNWSNYWALILVGKCHAFVFYSCILLYNSLTSYYSMICLFYSIVSFWRICTILCPEFDMHNQADLWWNGFLPYEICAFSC